MLASAEILADTKVSADLPCGKLLGTAGRLGVQLDSSVESKTDVRPYQSIVADEVISFLPKGLAPDKLENWIVLDSHSEKDGFSGASVCACWNTKDPQRGTYKAETHHRWLNNGQLAPISYFVSPTPPLSPAYWNAYLVPYLGVDNAEIYDIYQTPVDLGLEITDAVTDPSSQTVTSCNAPITIKADLTPPLPAVNEAPPITWGGGTTVDNLHRQVACALGNTTVTARFGAYLQASLAVNVQGAVSFSGSSILNGKIVAGTSSTVSITGNSSVAGNAVYVWEIIPDDPNAPAIAQLPGPSPYSPPSCNGNAACPVAISATQTGGKATIRLHLRSTLTGPDVSSQDVRLIVVQIKQVNLTVASHVGGGTTTQTFTTPFGPGPLQWPAAVWTPPSAAVLVSSSVPYFTLNAVSMPAANDPDVLGWLAFDTTHRAPDDAAQAIAVGGGVFATTAYPTGTATISANLAGSFQILVCVDTSLNNQCDQGETELRCRSSWFRQHWRRT